MRTYLNDAAAGLLQIRDLLTQGQGNLVRLLGAGDVLAGEGPVNASDSAGQHPLDIRTVRHGLRQLKLMHGHGALPGDITSNQRRAHVTRAIRLHPSMLREGVALQLHSKIFDLFFFKEEGR